MSEQYCSINGLHDGPFVLCLWKEEGRKGWMHSAWLCESCATRVGAWKLPAKPEQVEEDDPNYHGEDEAPDDVAQPINYSGYGNPYEPYQK